LGIVKCFTYTNPPPVSPFVSYGWTYAGVTNNIVFIVSGSTDFVHWSVLGVVTNKWFTVAKDQAHFFYRVMASNTVTGFYSGEF